MRERISMRLGDLRNWMEDLAALPDDTIIGVSVENESGYCVDMELEELYPWEHEGTSYLYLRIVPQA